MAKFGTLSGVEGEGEVHPTNLLYETHALALGTCYMTESDLVHGKWNGKPWAVESYIHL